MMAAERTEALIGRKKELHRLREAIRRRESLLLWGAHGSGKTALIESALRELPPATRSACLVCSGAQSPKELWRQVIERLAAAADPEVLLRWHAEEASGRTPSRWAAGQSSVRLRGIFTRALRARDYWLFLDHLPLLSPAIFRVLKGVTWSRRTPVYLTANKAPGEEPTRNAARLFWHSGMRLELGPLAPEDAALLFHRCIAGYALSKLDLAELRSMILECGGGLPGAIVRLCEMASQTAYQSAGRVKTHTLAIDFRLQCRAAELHSLSGPSRHD